MAITGSSPRPATVPAVAVAAAPPADPSMVRRSIVALAALTLLAGCTANRDFGEVRPGLVRDDIHDWLGPAAAAPFAASHFELTDEERHLRDLAFPLIEPPYERQQSYAVALEYGAAGTAGVSRTSYADYLLGSHFRSPSGRYAQITEDIRNDITRLPAFFEAASRVADIDLKRRKSFGYVHDLSPGERDEALRRIRENASLISLVRIRLMQRVAAYRFAMERLVVIAPSPQAVEVERALSRLQDLIAYYRTPVRPWTRESSLAASR
jgi:hypothetical protein